MLHATPPVGIIEIIEKEDSSNMDGQQKHDELGLLEMSIPASKLHDTNFSKDEPLSLTWKDFDLGEVLGSGSFASVYQIKPLHPSLMSHQIARDPDCGSDASDSTKSHFSSASERSLKTPCGRRFALKTVNQRALSNPKLTADAIQGLQGEVELLSELPPHQNIISLVGLSTDKFEVEDPIKGFIVLERLTETLEERLQRWKNRKNVDKKKASLLKNILRRRQSDEPEQRIRATHVALGIAQGMAFLHGQGVLFRDLKPSNIGFDYAGTVRIFDFGLARRLDEDDSNEEKRLTFCVGNLRTMSPEMYMGTVSYSFPVDVYSFAMLLWQIITLNKPFAKVRSADQLVDIAITNRQRPSLKDVHSKDIRDLLTACWDHSPECRPTFAAIVAQLDVESRKSYRPGSTSG